MWWYRVVVFICISLAPGEMMHFLCSLLIDDVHFILCELLANPSPVFLFESRVEAACLQRGFVFAFASCLGAQLPEGRI